MPAVACLLAMAALAAADPAPAAKASPAIEPTDPKDLSAAFWTGWRAEAAGDRFTSAMSAAGGRATVAKAVGDGPKTVQHVADMAITDPKQAAPILAAAAQAGQPREIQQALETALVMRTSAKVRAEAATQTPPEIRAAATRFAVNLSTGIPGLPGVYLNASQSGPRTAAPAGYALVGGGSAGCSGG